MAYFEWADDLVIDHGPIDDDHRLLVSVVNDLHSATSRGEGHEVVHDLLTRLIDYTQQHFTREEHLMHQLHFPQTDRHSVGHQRFIADLRQLQERYDAGSLTVASRMSSLLRDWLSLHIRRSDQGLRKHYVERYGSKP